mgnify:CR=1 FL=1
MLEIMSNEELAQAKILVIGVGGAGNNAVNRMVDEAIEGVELIGINTDKQALDLCKAPTRVQIGEKLTKGLGAGAKPEIGAAAVDENRDEITELVKEADVITLHVPLLDSTKHMIGEKQFEEMKDHVIIVNTARGGLIDDEALAKALVNGKVAAAGLDCVENENLQENSLARMSNVILTPHMGGSSNDLAAEMIPKIAEQIKNLEMTGTIGNVVNKEYLK